MKKIILFVMIILFTCGCHKMEPRDVVINFLEEYKTLGASVISSLENSLEEETWSDKEKDKYRRIIKRQYKDMEYEILNERYEDEKIFIETKITVYDYYKAQEDANYYSTNTDLSYLEYKLDMMDNTTDRISYTIIFNIIKDENNNYRIVDFSNSDIEKIHGIYNYN